MALFNFSNNNKRTILIGLGALLAAVIIDVIIGQLFGDSVAARAASLVVLVVAAIIAVPMTVNSYVDNRRNEMGEEHAAPIIEEYRKTKDRKAMAAAFEAYLKKPNIAETRIGVMERLAQALIDDGYLKDARKIIAIGEPISTMVGAKGKYDKAVAALEASMNAKKR